MQSEKDYKAYQQYDGKEITVCGWARTIRDSKNIGFLSLNDGAFKCLQVVLEREKLSNYDDVVKQTVGASFCVRGTVIVTPEAQQPFEINASEVEILGTSDVDYPLQKKRHTLEFLREQAYLRPRTNLFSAVFRVRSEVAFAIHKFFNERGFVYVHTPLITCADCEGSDQMFKISTLKFDNLPFDEEGKIDYLINNDIETEILFFWFFIL